MASFISKLIHFIFFTSGKHNIDESHGISHSMNVLHYAQKIYISEVPKFPELQKQERSIYVSALIHDMCDKKYMDEKEGIQKIKEFLCDKITEDEIDTTKAIISTMSYSKVKKVGYPKMDEPSKQLAYHIVREADLLTAYDFDRSVLYHMHNSNSDIHSAYENAMEVFENRVLRQEEDGLFVTDFSKNEAVHLKMKALDRIQGWKILLKNRSLT